MQNNHEKQEKNKKLREIKTRKQGCEDVNGANPLNRYIARGDLYAAVAAVRLEAARRYVSSKLGLRGCATLR